MASPLRIRLRRCLLLLAGLLLLGVGMLVWQTEAIVNRILLQWLSTQELQRLDIEVEHIGLSSLRLRALAEDPGWRVRLEQLEVRFDLPTLWRDRRIEEVFLHGLYVYADLSQDLPLHFQAEIDLPGGAEARSESVPERPDFSWIAELPLQRFIGNDIQLELKQGERALILNVDAEMVRQTAQSLGFSVRLDSDVIRTHLSGTVRDGAETSVRVDLALREAVSGLDDWWPQWSDSLNIPDDFRLTLPEVQAKAHLRLPADGKWQVEGRTVLSQLRVALNPGYVQMGDVVLDWLASFDQQTAFDLQAASLSGQWEDAFIPEQSFQLSGISGDQTTWKVRSEQVLQWSYGEDLASGATRAEGSLRLASPDTGLPDLSMQLHFEALQAMDFAFAPFAVSLRGDFSRFQYELSPLALLESGHALFVGGSGEVILAEMPEDPLHMSFQGQLVANAAAHWLSGFDHDAISLVLSLGLAPEQTTVDLDFNTPEGEFRWAFGDAQAVLRQAQADLRLQLDPAWTELGGAFTFESEGPVFSIEDLTGEGWALSGGLALRSVPMNVLMQDEWDLTALADLLGLRISGQVEWMINHIQMADTVEANWLSGAFELAASNLEAVDPLDLSSSLSVGILRVMGEPVEQVWVSTRQRGDSGSLKMMGDFSFSYAGSFAGGTMEHILRDPFSSPSLEGQFELQPLTLDYVDAVGRHLPALESLSFSGDLLASGRYWIREGMFDASLDSVFKESSVDYPASQIKAEGITIHKHLDSLVQQQGTLRIEIHSVQAGDIHVEEGSLFLRLNGMERISFEHGSLHAFGGQLLMDPMEIQVDPLNLKGGVRFEHLSLDALTRQMSFFDGRMDGFVSGAMPFSVVNGAFIPEEGHLRLSEGEVARLFYNAKGLLSAPETIGPPPKLTFSERISARLMERFRLQPEVVVEDALGNLTITQLDIALFPEDTPTTPIRIRFEGEAPAGPANVPVRLQTNVHGTLDELYNFLIRLNSLGPATF